MKITSIIGTRPQIIKISAICREADKHDDIQHSIICTGQHYDHNMTDVFLGELDIPVISHRGDKSSFKGMVSDIKDGLNSIKPDAVLLYGDTNSTLAGAIASANYPMGHVEAGLRSGNLEMAEERIRIRVDEMSDFLFTATHSAIKNLETEEVKGKVFRVDDIIYDNLWYYHNKIHDTNIGITEPFIFATVHRKENVMDDKALRDIFEGIILGAEAVGLKVFIPMHPRTRDRLISVAHELLLSPSLIISEPISYLKTLAMLDKCSIVVTDSGGIQRESNFFLKPCVVVRNETEWVEQVSSGGSVLCGSDKNKIKSEIEGGINKIYDPVKYGLNRGASQILTILKKEK